MVVTGEASFRILVLNFGSTSTKVGIYQDEEQLFAGTVRYEPSELARYGDIFEQRELRMEGIRELLDGAGFSLGGFDAVVSRGCIAKPVNAGVYELTDELVADGVSVGGHHPVSLGVSVALELGRNLGIPALTVDMPSVDQLSDVARITGMPGVGRCAIWQPLNHRQVARTWAAEHGTSYEGSNLVIAHLGGGTTVAAHERGRAIDVNNGTEGDGPMTPERCGEVPLAPIIEICYSGELSKEEMLNKVRHGSGVAGYLGTADMVEVERRALSGDAEAKLVLDALCHQVAKEIGGMFAVLRCSCDAILLTGGVAHSKYVTETIRGYVEGMAPVFVYPGEDELGALAQGALRALRGEEPLQEYEKSTSDWSCCGAA